MESREEYLIRHLAEAENALFEARNAYMGTGSARNDARARRLDGMRATVAEWARDEERMIVK